MTLYLAVLFCPNCGETTRHTWNERKYVWDCDKCRRGMKENKVGYPLTTKQTWILSTVALSGGITKYRLEQLWSHILLRGLPFESRFLLTNDDSFNMRKTLDSLVEAGLLKEDEGKGNITLYHISSHILGLLSSDQPYKPRTRKVMTNLSKTYFQEE